MPNIARTTQRPVAAHGAGGQQRTRVLLVRPPAKSVRAGDERDRTPLRLAIGVIVALGTLASIWLMGYLGYRLGFAELVRVRDLQIEGSGGLATGTLMLIGLPRVILEAGVAQPMWLMIGFGLIAVPAASLGAIKSFPRGGPKPNAAVVAVSFIGAVAAAVNGVLLIWWTISPFRLDRVRELPFDPADASQWLANLQTVGGLDALGTVAAALWVVVVLRLHIPAWARALSASACFFALVVIMLAMSMTNATVSQLSAGRSVSFLDDGSVGTRLVLGFTPRHIATLKTQDGTAVVELRDHPSALTVIGTQSIVEFLSETVEPPNE